ncbi:hypothetical protein B0H14DRAFT_2610724 [Mycena olivaceomarginata]|nr:hypothetical protein B0H14DRAFT_2610724 [Mycena olivaceomarginata]
MINLRWLSVFCLTGAMLLPLTLATVEQIEADIGVFSADFIRVDNNSKVPSLNFSHTQVILNDSSVIPGAPVQAARDVQITGHLNQADGSVLLTLWKNVEITYSTELLYHATLLNRKSVTETCTAHMQGITVGSNGSPVTVDDVTSSLALVIAAYKVAASTDSIRS